MNQHPETEATCTIAFDRRLAWRRGNSVRYLVIEVAAPVAPRREEQARLPLNLALVLDASGSMGRGKLAKAKEAALRR